MNKYPEWRATTKYTVAVGLAIFGVYLIYLSRNVLPTLIVAALIAFLLRPLVNLLQRKLRLPKGAAVLLAYFLAVALLALSPLVVLPPVVNTANYLASLDYQALVNEGVAAFEQWLLAARASGISILGFRLSTDALIDPILEVLRNSGALVAPQLPSVSTILQSIQSVFYVSYGVVGSVSSGLLSSFYLFLACIYLSMSGENLAAKVWQRFPAAYQPEVEMLIVRMQSIWDAFFRGQVSLMLIIGVTVWIGAMILGLPGAAALGVVAGLLEIIPSLGPILATIPAVIVALLQGSSTLPVSNLTFALIVIGFYVLVQAFENNVIVPKVLGEAVNLHPLVVMTGVLVGASVAGILGALLAAPVVASIKEIVSYAFNKLMGQDPFPEPVYPPASEQPALLENVKAGAARGLAWVRTLPQRWGKKP